MDQDDGDTQERRRTPLTGQKPYILTDNVLSASAGRRKARALEQASHWCVGSTVGLVGASQGSPAWG